VRKIAVLNQKGGVGKTTTVVNISAALAQKGHRVLVIDLDPQAHLTIHLGADQNPDTNGVYEVLTDGLPLAEASHQVRENLWLLGASIDLVGAESELVNEVGREIILREAINSVHEQFDYVMIDCPPSLGLLTLNALAAVDEVMIPIQPHFLALQGFSRLLQTVTLVQTRINPALRVSTILMCMFDSRTSLSGEVREDIKRFLSAARESDQPWANAKVVPIHIRRNIKLAEAPSHGQTIFEYEPNCHGAADYQAVAAFLAGTDVENNTSSLTDGRIDTTVQEDTSNNAEAASMIEEKALSENPEQHESITIEENLEDNSTPV
jgi:chromosome partitioning protein